MKVGGLKLARRTARRIVARFAPGPVVLCYHRVTDDETDHHRICVSSKNFQEQLEVLRRRAAPLSLDELATGLNGRGGRFPRHGVAITFDDGYADNLCNALPLLEDYGCPATVYVISDALGSEVEFWWDELAVLVLEERPPEEELVIVFDGKHFETSRNNPRVVEIGKYFFGDQMEPLTVKQMRFLSLYLLLHKAKEGARQEILSQLRSWCGVEGSQIVRKERRMLTQAEMLELDRSDLVEIGSHTATHPLLSAHSPEWQRKEIFRGKQVLEQQVGHAVSSFAYPHGGYDQWTMALAAEAGFSTAVTCRHGMVRRNTSAWSLPRQVVGNWPGSVFEQHLNRWWKGYR